MYVCMYVYNNLVLPECISSSTPSNDPKTWGIS